MVEVGPVPSHLPHLHYTIYILALPSTNIDKTKYGIVMQRTLLLVILQKPIVSWGWRVDAQESEAESAYAQSKAANNQLLSLLITVNSSSN